MPSASQTSKPCLVSSGYNKQVQGKSRADKTLTNWMRVHRESLNAASSRMPSHTDLRHFQSLAAEGACNTLTKPLEDELDRQMQQIQHDRRQDHQQLPPNGGSKRQQQLEVTAEITSPTFEQKGQDTYQKSQREAEAEAAMNRLHGRNQCSRCPR